MGKWKWILGGLTWVLTGPIGGLIGFFIGSAIDGLSGSSDNEQVKPSNRTRRTEKGDFMVVLLTLSAAVMKADNIVKKSELEYVKAFLVQNFGKEKTLKALQLLKPMLNAEIPLDDVCRQIRYNMNNSLKLQLLHYLFGIANADNEIVKEELDVLKRIATGIGISDYDFNSIKSMFIVVGKDSDYEILGITKDATNEEVKKAYKKMAMKHHPDKVAGMGEEVTRKATEKFQAINEAYDRIKKERNMA
ncbi:MAG: TerB family tellurite resistance protein [Bacteroidales bacterium]|nr:TerB family tellurite resistance protein [Bacteroidales bacterium]